MQAQQPGVPFCPLLRGSANLLSFSGSFSPRPPTEKAPWAHGGEGC